MVNLNQLADNAGARKNRIRVGRGIGSGKGKTCGRGVKGQKARTGVAIRGFEGGQMPIFRRLPKRGFTNVHRSHYNVLNLLDIVRAIEAGHLSQNSEISIETLVAAGMVRNANLPVKLLGKGVIDMRIMLSVDSASKKAIEAIEKSGGRLTLSTTAND